MSEHQSEPQPSATHGASAMSGLIVFVILAVMTVAEYIIATHVDAKLLALVVIAFAKAVLILWYFMHVARAWLTRGGAH